MKKTLVLIIFVFAMIISLSSHSIDALASSTTASGNCGSNATWWYDMDTKVLTVSGVGSIDGFRSTRCGPWKEYIGEVEHIVIEEGITFIGFSAFEGCFNLKRLDLPSTLLAIDQNAFYKCEYSLDRVIIPENVSYIGCNAFAGWTNGHEPNHVTYAYFLGNAPESLKDAGAISNSFSEFTTLYYLPEKSGWYGSTFKGYHIEPWDGINYIDKNYSEEDISHIDNDNCDLIIDVIGTKCYDYAYSVIDKVNELRSNLGLDALCIDDKLMSLAMQRAAECSVYYSHDRPNDVSSGDCFPAASIVGENIAAGQVSPSQVMSMWEASPGHYANIIESQFTSIGVGCFYTGGTYYWVQSFSNGTQSVEPLHSNEETVVSIPINLRHLSISGLANHSSLKVGETIKIELLANNTTFSNAKTPIIIPIHQCEWTSEIITFDLDSFSVTALSPGEGSLSLFLANGAELNLYYTVQNAFTDVTMGDWYYDAVIYVYKNGLMCGTSRSVFNPNLATTRAMIAMILYNLEGNPDAPYYYFKDVSPDAWYADAVSWLASTGIANGYGQGLFGPEDSLTREQVAVILYNYAKYKNYSVSETSDLSDFDDANRISSFALLQLGWANGIGLINGIGNKMLDPKGTATRAQIANILMRFIEHTEETA